MTPERLREIAEAAMEDRGWQTKFAQDELDVLAPDLARVAAGLAEAIQAALSELGIPTDDYPAPVANAAEILRHALAAFEQLREQNDTQAATEVRVSGEESKATTGTVT